jgi:serine/threonine protein kinase
MQDLFNAVAYLHKIKVVHRDIKPANVMFADETKNKIKLIDFGLSRMTKNSTIELESVVGTMFYIAPEIIRGRVYNEKVDLWSLGVLMFVLLSGEHPFETKERRMDELIKKTKEADFNLNGEKWKCIS